jgi:hypothetical protein
VAASPELTGVVRQPGRLALSAAKPSTDEDDLALHRLLRPWASTAAQPNLHSVLRRDAAITRTCRAADAQCQSGALMPLRRRKVFARFVGYEERAGA